MSELQEFEADTVDNLDLIVAEKVDVEFDPTQFELPEDYDETEEVVFDEHA